MKNFRKVLALILVVATLFSFAAMTSAKEYKDSDKISYDQAVDVLSAIGILEGYPDGSFKPADSIAREEMAKMVAVLSNAGDDVSELYASACKFGDTKDRWSASYVAYCNETGIVAGRNASTFDPRGKVTGIETAKMLLCLIGFDATAQGYVGTNWKTNVLRDAKAAGLLDGFAEDYDVAKAITREEAANMMLNALLAPMVVGTISNNVVTFSNKVWIDLTGDAIKVGSYMNLKDAAAKYDCYVLYGNVVVSNIGVWQNYKGLNVDYGNDCYGNPSVVWTYKKANGTVLFKKAYTMNPTYSSTKPVNFASLLSEEVASDKDYDLCYYVDGKFQDTLPLKQISMKQLSGLSGKGVLTNVYIFDGDRFKKDDGSYYDDSCIVVTYKNTFIDEVTETYAASSTFTMNGKTYDNSKYGFEKGDIVLYWICDGTCGCTNKLHDAKLATPVTTDVTRVTYSKNSLSPDTATVISKDGKTYEYAANLFKTIGHTGEDIILDVTGSDNGAVPTYELYFDEYGYIMAWWETNSKVVRDVAYYVPNTLKNDGFRYVDGEYVTTWTADFVDFTGTKNTVTLYATSRNASDVRALQSVDGYAVDNPSRDTYGALVSYKLVGEKVVLDPDTRTISGLLNNGQTPVYFGCTAGVEYYLSKNGSLVNSDDKSVYMSGNANTKYLVKTGDEYKAYNFKNLPASLFSSDDDTTGQSYAIQYFYKQVGSKHEYQLAYVFIDAKYTMSNTTAFVAGYSESISDQNFADKLAGKDYDAYSAIIGGKKAVLAVDSSKANELNLDTKFQLVNATLQYIGVADNDVPIYTLVKFIPTDLELSETLIVDEANRTVTVFDESVGAGKLMTYTLADDAVVVVASAPYEDGKFNTSKADVELPTLERLAVIASDFNKGDGTSNYELNVAWYTIKDGEMTELYITLVNAGGTQGSVDPVRP